MSPELIGPLGLPGWMVALATVFYIGLVAKDRLTGKPHKNGLSVQANIISAISSLAAAVDGMARDIEAVKDNQQSMASRLEIMPTREEVKDIAAKNRQLLREEAAKLAGMLVKLRSGASIAE